MRDDGPMRPGSETRPDGRALSPATVELRVATRSLRFHLEELPIAYDLGTTPERLLANLSFMSARNRYSCADSMIGAGFGGTIVGAIARSLFVEGLRWAWIADDPTRGRCLLGTLLDERNRLCALVDEAHVSCPTLPRWLMPIPNVADLAGVSMAWLDAPSLPTEEALLERFLSQPRSAFPADEDQVRTAAAELLLVPGIQGAVMVLAHAGHGNYLGLQSSLTEDGVPAHDLRADHEALFMHVAAVGATTTLIGTAAAAPELWPAEVDRDDFLRDALKLAAAVAHAAAPLHGLVGPPSTARTTSAEQGRSQTGLVRPNVVVPAADWLPDVTSVTQVAEAAERYFEVARRMAVSPWSKGDPVLHAVLTYAGAHSGLEAVMATYDQAGSEVIAVFAARGLLEEAARLHWRYSAPDGEAFKARAKQYFDEFRARRKATINTLAGTGIPRANAERLFARPTRIRVATPDDDIARGRTPIPPIAAMVRDLGIGYPEPNWLEVAYSLLSQVSHATPLGLLHTVRFLEEEWRGNQLSPEMLGLSLDVACLSSAILLGTSSLVLTDMNDDAVRYKIALTRAAAEVHDAARLVHGLD